jgi:hypothetical protein
LENTEEGRRGGRGRIGRKHSRGGTHFFEKGSYFSYVLTELENLWSGFGVVEYRCVMFQ